MKNNKNIQILPLEILQKYDYEFDFDESVLFDKIIGTNNEAVIYATEKALLDKWKKYKKVYNLDGTFANVLMNTEIENMPISVIKSIPFQSFYLRLNDNNKMSSLDGILAYIEIADNKVLLRLVIYQKNDYENFMLDVSNYDIINNEVSIKYEESESRVVEVNETNINEDVLQYCDKNKSIIFSKIIMQFLMYFSSKEPDIVENYITKKTYKPRKSNKNKFSEIQMWDVGVRYGNAIRLALEESKNQLTNDSYIDDESVNHKLRKSPRMHVRRAHWRRARTGKGRTEISIIWIPPMIICGDKTIEVTIHETSLKDEG